MMTVATRKAEDSSGRPSLRELEILHALLKFSKTIAAARALDISQPAVSRSIASLETKLGKPLFKRSGGLLVPTQDALVLDQKAGEVLRAFDVLTERTLTGMHSSKIRIVTTATLGHHFLAPLIPSFLKDNADALLEVEIASSFEVGAAVADQRADVGIVDSGTPYAGVRSETLRRGVAHVVLPAGHALADRDHLGPEDIASEPMIALARRFIVRALVDQSFRNIGLQPRIVMEAATSTLAADMVCRGVGLSILNPFPLVFDERLNCVFREFRPAIPFETVALTSGTGGPPHIVRTLIDLLQKRANDACWTSHP